MKCLILLHATPEVSKMMLFIYWNVTRSGWNERQIKWELCAKDGKQGLTPVVKRRKRKNNCLYVSSDIDLN